MKRHFILVAVGSAGDVHPMAAVAQALKSRGHRVTLIASGYFAELADAMRLDFVGLGTRAEYQEAMRDPELWHPRRGLVAIWKRISPHLQDCLDWIQANRDENTVLVGTTLALSARIARDTSGLPLATIHLAPMALMSANDPPQIQHGALPGWIPRAWVNALWNLADLWLLDPAIAPDINAIRQKAGLPPVKHIMRRYIHSPDKVLLLYPEWFAPNPGDWPANSECMGFPRFDEAGLNALPEGLEEFLEAGEKPLLFTPGSAMQHAHRFFENAVACCKTLNKRGIIVTPYPQQLPPLPANIKRFDYIPFSQVLSRVALVAHHGGIGTCSQGLAAGIPQLVVANAHDQFDNGNRLKRLGVGDFLSTQASADQFTQTVSTLLNLAQSSLAFEHWQQQLQSPPAVLENICQRLEAVSFRASY